MTEKYEYEPHNFKPCKAFHWALCYGCGLVQLKNDRTKLCTKLGCNYEDHKEWIAENKRRRK